ncbi:MAG: hypothetical protein KU29_00205 [Sulfurovum sp. FS06-10]|nr:MAG: hypothetical protein KU29_00205 [Sulfurovum sp. FS06-10]
MKDLFGFSLSLLGLFFLIFNTISFFLNKKVKIKTEQTFLWYLFSLCIVEILCHILGFLYFGSNFFISHFYYYFQLLFLSILFKNLIANKIFKKIILGVLLVQTCILLFTYLKTPVYFWQFNTYEIISISFILIVYAVYYIISNLSREHKYFNFSIGLIFYLACSIAIFSVGNLELVLYEDPFIDIWIFNVFFYIVFQFFIFKEYLFLKLRNNN